MNYRVRSKEEACTIDLHAVPAPDAAHRAADDPQP
jgi:hypothetical protein